MSKLALIEAHPLLRLGLQQILSKLEGSWEVVGIAPDELDLVAEDNKDVELLLFGQPIETPAGWQALADVRRILAPKRILLLVDTVPIQALSRLQDGYVCGCMMKHASIELLEAAIRLVMAGGQCFPSGHTLRPELISLHPDIKSDIRPNLSGRAAEAEPEDAMLPQMPMSTTSGAQLLNITPRQYEVLVLLSRGYPIKTVSRLLNISVATAKTHACTLYQRLQVKNKGEAVYAALRRGATLNWDAVHVNGKDYDRNNA